MKEASGGLPVVGWREWVALPELGIPAIKAKVDTGARTSALHAVRLEVFRENRVEMVRFWVQPLRKRRELELCCQAEVLEHRMVSDSGGHREKRLVICSKVVLAGLQWPLEITLTDRYTMLFPMLLGRTALAGRFLVDPALSYHSGRSLSRSYAPAQKRRIQQ